MLFYELQPDEVSGWVRAFSFTQIVEVPIYFFALSLPAIHDRMATWKALALAFLCSLLTHPVVWFVFPRLIDSYEHYERMVVAAETFAVTAEAAILYLARTRWAFFVSLLANMTSMSLGFLIRYRFHWF